MTNTVTISLKDYELLKGTEKAFNEKLLLYSTGYGVFRTCEPNEALDELNKYNAELRERISMLKKRGLISRIFNHDIY